MPVLISFILLVNGIFPITTIKCIYFATKKLRDIALIFLCPGIQSFKAALPHCKIITTKKIKCLRFRFWNSENSNTDLYF